MPLQQTTGNVTTDAYGGGVAAVTNYIEDVFSTYLYTGNGSTQTITNGIDLATKGGLIWSKARSSALSNFLCDTDRGRAYYLYSNATVAQQGPSSAGSDITSFNSNGYSLGPNANADINTNAVTFASWTFRKQPKFFDVVTWTGDGNATQTISHNLGSVPGCIIAKVTSTTGNWFVYHRGTSATPLQDYTRLNLTNATNASGSDLWGATSTTITVDSGLNLTTNGATYVAYLFAHNAGGFGLTGTDNVISCGSYTANGNNTIELGYEPQWIMVRRTNTAGNDWEIYDTMRGCSLTGSKILVANTSGAEGVGGTIYPTATGFYNSSFGSGNIIYIAIRRGPMKVPTSGTSVFSSVTRTGTGANATISGVGFAPDVLLSADRNSAPQKAAFYDKLRGVGTQGGGAALLTSSSTFEQNYTDALLSYTNTGVNVGAEASTVTINYSGEPFVTWFFQRAPSFFDEVCWTGTGSGSQAITHNLGVAPEFTITKRRSGTGNWSCFPVMFGVNTGIYLDSTAALQTNAALHPTLPTSTTYYTNDASWGDENIGGTFVTYLFATCAGVSKVGSYTGNGTTQTINCGFTGGARFVLIKRTDSTGDWYVYDTARGMTTLTDPYLRLNSTAAESATLGSVTTVSTGFAVNASILAAINTNAASYIFLAIA